MHRRAGMQAIRRRSVVDVALQGDVVEAYGVAARAKALNRLRGIDTIFRVLTRAAALGVLVLLGGVIISIFGNVPVLSTLFAGPPYGIGILTAALILAIMVLPFVTSISRDVFDAVPPVLKEAAYGIGCTTWEVVRYVVLPYARVGVIGGVMLGLGRALGETMAVTFVIGNAHRVSSSLLAPGTTISATIANEFTEAVGDLYTSSLIALGLILFVITFIVLAIARYMLLRLERRIA